MWCVGRSFLLVGPFCHSSRWSTQPGYFKIIQIAWWNKGSHNFWGEKEQNPFPAVPRVGNVQGIWYIVYLEIKTTSTLASLYFFPIEAAWTAPCFFSPGWSEYCNVCNHDDGHWVSFHYHHWFSEGMRMEKVVCFPFWEKHVIASHWLYDTLLWSWLLSCNKSAGHVETARWLDWFTDGLIWLITWFRVRGGGGGL